MDGETFWVLGLATRELMSAIEKKTISRLDAAGGFAMRMPVAMARKTPGRGALVVVAGGRSIGCTLRGTRRARARTSGYRARRATVGGRKVLKARRAKGRHVLAPACAVRGWNKQKK